MPKLLVFIPTYNECDNVELICNDILALGIELDILFLDDNSPDGTGQLLDDLAMKHSNVQVIHRTGKLGIGSAHLEGIRHAYSSGYEFLITMDCDFTHMPSDILPMLQASEGYDITIGSRYLQNASLEGWSIFRKSLTLFAHFLTKTLLKLDCDASGAFRIYNLKRIPLAAFELIAAKSYSFFFESLFILINNGATVKEIPIVLTPRTYGHSKMTFGEAFRSARFLLRLSIENLVNPGRFRMGRKINSINYDLQDPQNWDPYWKRKRETTIFIYEVIAAVYRQLIIKTNLKRELAKYFSEGAVNLLHAGCGGGQVDMDLHTQFRISAVDISLEALNLYSRNNPHAYHIDHGSILHLPYPDSFFDGAYNQGVFEHFTHNDINQILREFHRVLKPGGKIVIFWPHRHGSSVIVLKILHFLLNKVLKKDIYFHPPEISLICGKSEATQILENANFSLLNYAFSARDFYIQATVVGVKNGD